MAKNSTRRNSDEKLMSWDDFNNFTELNNLKKITDLSNRQNIKHVNAWKKPLINSNELIISLNNSNNSNDWTIVPSRKTKNSPISTQLSVRNNILSDSNIIDSNIIDSNNIDSNNIDSNNIDSNNVDSNNVDSNNVDSNNVDSNNVDSNNVDNSEDFDNIKKMEEEIKKMEEEIKKHINLINKERKVLDEKKKVLNEKKKALNEKKNLEEKQILSKMKTLTIELKNLKNKLNISKVIKSTDNMMSVEDIISIEDMMSDKDIISTEDMMSIENIIFTEDMTSTKNMTSTNKKQLDSIDQKFNERSKLINDENSDLYNKYKEIVCNELTKLILDTIKSNMKEINTRFEHTKHVQYTIELSNTDQNRNFIIGNTPVSFNFNWFLNQSFYKWIVRTAAEDIVPGIWVSLSKKDETWLIHCCEKTN